MCHVVLTNDGLDSFKPPPTVEILDLMGCWLLTEDALFLFSKRFPNVEMRHELVPAFRVQPDTSSPPPVHLKASQANSPVTGNLNLSPYFLGKCIVGMIIFSLYLDSMLIVMFVTRSKGEIQ